MAACKGCVVEELVYRVKFDGDENLKAFPIIVDHLNRKNVLLKEEHPILYVKESEILELMDFSRDHLDHNQIYFESQNQGWLPLEEISKVIDAQWIDQLILAENITPFYQPIVTTSKQLYAHEILARSYTADGKMISPQAIFSSARTRNRVYALDRLCRMTAVKQASKLPDQKIFINFLPTSIYSPDYCLRSTLDLASKIGADPSNLVFEVVETEKVEDVDHLKAILHYYREHGFQYALDDVGEGFSTVELLQELSPDYMKLDMKYVQRVSVDAQKFEIAKRFLEIANQIQAIPLAEGIENEADFECLKDIGYQLFQGYWLGKPAAKPVAQKAKC